MKIWNYNMQDSKMPSCQIQSINGSAVAMFSAFYKQKADWLAKKYGRCKPPSITAHIK
jgi:hypothetical protein